MKSTSLIPVAQPVAVTVLPNRAAPQADTKSAAIADPDLKVLAEADPEDLGIIVDHITDKGEGRLALSSDVCKLLVAAKSSNEYGPVVLGAMGRELQAFAGNSVANLVRGGGVPWKEAVCDVADHVGASYHKDQPVAEIEMAIIAKIAAKTVESMTPEERHRFVDEFPEVQVQSAGVVTSAALLAAAKLSGGFGGLKIAAIVANALAKAMLGRGLSLAATAGLVRTIGVLAGPVGWAITGVWTAFDLASPAYRVMLPCVVQVAYMRQKALHKQRQATQVDCPQCGAAASVAARFCSECGTPLAR